MKLFRLPGSNIAPYLFLLPFISLFLLFVAYPLVQSILLSLQQTFGPATSAYVGWKNYEHLFSDPLFWKATKNTFIYSLGTLAIQVPMALGLAILLNQPRLKGRLLLRLIFFAPSLVGVAFVAILFTPLFAKNTGLINLSLNALLPAWNVEYAWLEKHVMAALIVASVWMYVGINMLFFLAALQNVDVQLYEAASLDGARAVSRFWHVTLPGIWPVGSYVVLLSLIGTLQQFELPYILLNFGGGPDNRGLTLVMYLYQVGFEGADLGYASALGWCLTVVLLAVAVLQQKTWRRLEN